MKIFNFIINISTNKIIQSSKKFLVLVLSSESIERVPYERNELKFLIMLKLLNMYLKKAINFVEHDINVGQCMTILTV